METKKKKKQEKPVTVHITNHNKFEKGVGAFITNLKHLTIVMDEDGNMKMDMGQVPAMPQTQVDVERKESINKESTKEKLFKFIHPALDEEEARRIHNTIKRLVASYSIPEICKYLKEEKQSGKLMLPSELSAIYNELVRLGMPKGKGFSENHFKNNYLK